MAAPAITESKCGKCGYRVTGLPTFQCPECGSDLRDVGILKRETRAGPRKFRVRDLPREARAQLRRTLVVLGVLMILPLTVVMLYCTPTWSTQHYVDIFIPRSKAFAKLTLGSDFRMMRLLGNYYDEHQKSLPVVVTIVANDGSSHGMTVELPDLRMSYVVTRGSSWTWTLAFDQEELLKWLKDAGLDTSDESVRKDAGELVALIKTYHAIAPVNWKEFNSSARGELSTFDYRGFSSSTTFSVTSIIGVSAAGVIIYLLMVRRVLRKALAEGKAAMIAQGQWAEEPPVEKKAASRTLTVIFVDLKDFTGQAATISRARLLALLRQQRLMVEKAIAPFEGKIIKTMGDGIIATFESATNGVLAGMAVQEAAKKTALELRIGISTGEVSLEAEDVYGPAVNVAARLQSAANAGEVVFSEATRHAIHSAEIACDDLGAMELKGVPAPVGVFRART